MLSDLDPHSPLNHEPAGERLDCDRPEASSSRTRPRLTVYRMLSFSLTAGFGAIKAYMSYEAQVINPTTLDLVYTIVIVSALYWLGLYDEECPKKLPSWLFDVDVVDYIRETADGIRGLGLRALLRKVLGYAQESRDVEQRLQLQTIPPVLEARSQVTVTGIQINTQPIAHIRSRHWHPD
ncbi:hypothetical protein R3P38DRAFT_1942348 [Favolaschia claudopus]|uniref:Bestrophin homolog n=1 Tax=Favolaschia claudopus TaxID=2862362 RepID=A0AAW0A0N5_9AGAR